MKNEYEIRGDVVAIIINSNKYGKKEVLIDTSKLEELINIPYSWYVIYKPNTGYFYCAASPNRSMLYIHRLLSNASEGFVVDHINHNTLDNRIENLRVITQGENLQNQKGAKITSKSGVRGVHWSKKECKWHASLKVNGLYMSVGYFNNIEDAEKAVREARFRHMPFTMN